MGSKKNKKLIIPDNDWGLVYSLLRKNYGENT